MTKRILITGATSGIGKQAALQLSKQGHQLLVHGRSGSKLQALVAELTKGTGAENVSGYQADLGDLAAVARLAEEVKRDHSSLDVVINNAGVFKTATNVAPSGHDLRFVVNTFAPFLLTKLLLPLLCPDGRVVNLSSAAQNPVSLGALRSAQGLPDFASYAQSKLALTMWSCEAGRGGEHSFLALNPGSLLGTKMVREGFGVPGKDIRIGSDIMVRAALSEEFAHAGGRYFDNDAGGFGSPHPDALDRQKCQRVVEAIDAEVDRILRFADSTLANGGRGWAPIPPSPCG